MLTFSALPPPDPSTALKGIMSHATPTPHAHLPLMPAGVRLPLVQAPMAGSQDHGLACAVFDAGGLGSLPAAMLSPPALQASLEHLEAHAQAQGYDTRRWGLPFNINAFCHTPAPLDGPALAAWQQRLAPAAATFGLDWSTVTEEGALALASTANRRPFDAEVAALLERFRPAVVSFHFGLPEPALLQRIRGWGGRIWSTATTVAEARWLEAQGVDAIIAQGLEAGGHRGMFLSSDLDTQLGLQALVPQIVRAVGLPVIAAGGIADAQGVKAALSLGAQAVQIGTAFLTCPEARTSPVHRAALRSSAAEHTALTTLFSGRPARGIVNRVMTTWGARPQEVPGFPWASGLLQPIRQAAEAQGLGDFSPLWCGQVPPQWPDRPAAEVVRQLMGEMVQAPVPKGYWVARVDVHDLERYQEYVRANAEAFAHFGAKFLVRGGPFTCPEGSHRSRNVVLEFPSVQAARDCWHSASYQAALALRAPVSDIDLVIVEGYEGPQPRAGG